MKNSVVDDDLKLDISDAAFAARFQVYVRGTDVISELVMRLDAATLSTASAQKGHY